MSFAMHRKTTAFVFLLTVWAQVLLSIPLRTPWIVTIQQQWNGSTRICRGAVVDRVRVLTVATCIHPLSEGVQLDVKRSNRSQEWKVVNVTVHPTADLALLYVDTPFPVSGSLIGLKNIVGKPTGIASVDTSSGLQEVPILSSDPCSVQRQQTSTDELFIPSMCDTALGSPLFQVHDNQTILIGLVSSIPEPCHGTPCLLRLTDISHHYRWLSDQFSDEQAPSIKLPKIPATVVFSFLKLLAVVGSLGGISFAFCCVMFLISN